MYIRVTHPCNVDVIRDVNQFFELLNDAHLVWSSSSDKGCLRMQAFSLGIKGVNKALRFILTAFYLSEDLTSRSKLRAL